MSLKQFCAPRAPSKHFETTFGTLSLSRDLDDSEREVALRQTEGDASWWEPLWRGDRFTATKVFLAAKALAADGKDPSNYHYEWDGRSVQAMTWDDWCDAQAEVWS